MAMRSQHLDKKFINQISSRLPHFKWKSNNLANFRCPLCGDSQKNSYKARGYLYEKSGSIVFHCHNCNVSMSFQNFLKKMDNQLYHEYLLEKFKDEPKGNTFSAEILVKNQKTEEVPAIDLPSIASLSKFHEARKYIESRKIPSSYFGRLFYAEKFSDFVNALTPAYKDRKLPNDKRIVIPFFYRGNDFSYLIARALDADAYKRYIAIKLNNNCQKLFGLDRFDKNKPAFIVEGPIDAMFLPNSLAKGDSDLDSSLLGYIDPGKTTFVLDNEPRNSAIVSAMKDLVKSGNQIFVWPEFIKSKDINAWILDGYTESEVLGVIHRNIHSGLQATLKISQWSKN